MQHTYSVVVIITITCIPGFISICVDLIRVGQEAAIITHISHSIVLHILLVWIIRKLAVVVLLCVLPHN